MKKEFTLQQLHDQAVLAGGRGAERERRRIRRAQRYALAELYGVRDNLPIGEARGHLTFYLRDLNAATKAPRKRGAK